MAGFGNYKKINVTIEDYMATVEMDNGELNFFDLEALCLLADCFADLDKEDDCRVLLLTSTGKAFSAGADFKGGGAGLDNSSRARLYEEAVRLFSNRKPVIAVVNGAAIGGGLGLALVSDFRVGCPQSRFSANFTRLGIHPGFGLSYTLPRLVGRQNANEMFFTGRRVKGVEAKKMGLLDRLVPREELLPVACAFAREIAISAPLAVMSIRETMRAGLPAAIKSATSRELSEQNWLFNTEDIREGVAAMAERREPDFSGK